MLKVSREVYLEAVTEYEQQKYKPQAFFRIIMEKVLSSKQAMRYENRKLFSSVEPRCKRGGFPESSRTNSTLRNN